MGVKGSWEEGGGAASLTSLAIVAPGDGNVSRVSLEFSYSTGTGPPPPGRDPTCCLRSIGIWSITQEQVGAPLEALSSPLQQVGRACR